VSKIQDALKKIQTTQPAPESQRKLASLDDTVTLSALPPDQVPEGFRDADIRYRGTPVVVDFEALAKSGYLASGQGQHRLADEFRQIKRPIISNIRGRNVARPDRANLIAVVSALPGEGKTFTCINLALSIAREKDLSVVLIDADCSRQHTSDLFAARGELGLLDLLRDESLRPNDVIMPTNVSSLSLMPAGAGDEFAVELLASRRMNELAATLSAEDPQRVVIFDSSPLLLTPEPVALSAHVGQIVIVVHAGHTSQHNVVTAVEKLDSSKAINAVLNQIEFSGRQGDYYGYYQYDQDASQSSEEDSGEKT
jgi:exopolysaccharide/PEP-CTERM locus tyrosine autokinase